MDTVQMPGVGLALSGGGFRATLFHLGGLWRLNELGWLPQVSCISSVSGGSIVAGLLGARWQSLAFDDHGVAVNFQQQVADPIRWFCTQNIDIPATMMGLFGAVPFVPAGSHYLAGAQESLRQPFPVHAAVACPGAGVPDRCHQPADRQLFPLHTRRPAGLQAGPLSGR